MPVSAAEKKAEIARLTEQAGAPLSDMSSMKVNRGWRTSYVPTPVSYLLRRYPTV